jgi:hypothetical protein
MFNRFIVLVAGTGFFFSRCSKKGLRGGFTKAKQEKALPSFSFLILITQKRCFTQKL